MVRPEIHQLLEHCVNASVECDGFVRLAHTALVERGIEHSVLIGRLISLDGSVRTPIHLWIELGDGNLIDYRARMWLGDRIDVPHGIFPRGAFPGWSYYGKAIDIPVLAPALVGILLQLHP